MDDGARQATGWHWLWDAYIGAICGTAIVAVVVLNERFPGNVPAAAALLGGMVVWNVTVGGGVPRTGELTWRSVTFVAVMLTLFTLALWFSRVAIVAIPAIYPVIFSALPMVTAIVVTTVVNVMPLAITLAVEGPRSPDILGAIAITLLGVVAAPVIGIMVVTANRQRLRLAAVVEELESTRAESARLSHEAGTAAERERLAREIHDTLAQGFTSIVTLAQAVEAELESDPSGARRHVELIRGTARENLTEAREMVAGLTPAALDEGSLPGAVRRQCERLTAETGIAVTVHADENLPALGMASDVVLLRATQEAFANIRKHAEASTVCVELSQTDQGVRLTLSDNGVGFGGDPAEGFGLRGMRARVAQVGGRMSVSSTPGDGVRIDIEVPS